MFFIWLIESFSLAKINASNIEFKGIYYPYALKWIFRNNKKLSIKLQFFLQTKF